MASNFAKLEKFEGVDFRRWQKKMHFMLSSMSVVYVLTTPMSEDGGENPTVEQNVETSKELWDTLDAKYMVEDASSKKFLVSNFTNYKMTDSRAVLEQYNELLGNVSNRANGSSTKGSEDGFSNPLKDQSMFNKSHQIYYVTYVSKAFFVQDDDVAWWVDSGASVHVCKDRCWFKTYESLNDGSILHMGNESTAFVHGRGCVDLRMQDMSKDGLIPAFDMDSEKCQTCMLNKITKKPFQNVKRETVVLELIHSDLCDLHATPSLGNKKYFVTFVDDASRFCYVYLLYSKDEALDKFKVFKTEVELQQGSLIKRFRTDRGEQNGISKRKNRVLKEMVNSMLSYSGLSQGFWEEVMAVVRLPDPKLKTLGERGIECIFVGYVEHSKAFRFYVIEPNNYVAINSIIESKDAIFDEHRFSSILRPSQRSLVKGTDESGGSVVSKRVTDEIVQQSEPRKSKRHMTPKDFGTEFQLYLVEGTRDEDVSFWKEAINDEVDSIMGNNTWVLTDLPLGCRPSGCKWIFKRKMKVDGTVEKFKARLVIQGFNQRSGIDYFDTYAPMARISTIRLLIVVASIHNLIIQMDVKTAFLNGELEKDVYMNQPLGFIMPGNKNKVCELIKSLYGLKQAPKQWHQKFDEVVLSNGYLLNQADKCVYSKFNAS
ncbi:zinc finger, CCHC-type containing protein, partial [Tanacetum coccineum]